MKPYRKPQDICTVTPDVEDITASHVIARFITSEKRRIEDYVRSVGYSLRMATWDDAAAIRELHARCWPPGHPTLEEPTLLWRIISWGFVPVIEASDGRVVGCNLNEGYDDARRTSYGVRVTVDPSASGYNFGAELARYSGLLGMERGSSVRRGSVGVTNYNSAANTLNHVGFVADAFFHDMPIHGDRLSLALPLTPGGLINNRIDLQKTKEFLDTRKLHRDYELVPCTDVETLAALYEDTPLRVAAFLRKGVAGPENLYLAVPVDCS